MNALILASQSASRKAMLTAAGVPFTAEAAQVDEESIKQSMLSEGTDGRRLADALAEMKAIKISRRYPTALVLGCDSTVTAADGFLIDKAESREASAVQLRALAGTTHSITSAAVVAQGGVPIWRSVDTAKLTMRTFSDEFLTAYLDAEWPAIGGCVGGYRIEGLGAQLFNRIDGDHFTILGLPLLPLLDWLRVRGVVQA